MAGLNAIVYILISFLKCLLFKSQFILLQDWTSILFIFVFPLHLVDTLSMFISDMKTHTLKQTLYRCLKKPIGFMNRSEVGGKIQRCHLIELKFREGSLSSSRQRKLVH